MPSFQDTHDLSCPVLEVNCAMKPTDPDLNTSYIDTPQGIISEMGTHFHTTEEQLEEYAGELLGHISLASLIKRANTWLQAPRNIAICIAPILLYYVEIPLAGGILIAIFLALSILGPVLVSHNLFILARGIDFVGFQALLYTAFLSYSAMSSNFLIFFAGILVFIGFRWGIIQWILSVLIKQAHRLMYSAPYEDQILKSVIIRASMKYRTELSELAEMEKALLNKLNRWP